MAQRQASGCVTASSPTARHGKTMIYDEWLVRDQGAVVRQLGIEPKRYAAERVAAEGGPDQCVRPLTPANDPLPNYLGSRQ